MITYTLNTVDADNMIVGGTVTGALADISDYAEHLESKGKRVMIRNADGRIVYPASAVPVDMITRDQVSAIMTMLRTRDLSAEQRPKYAARLHTIAAAWDTELANMTRDQASALRDVLSALPYRKAV